MKVKIKEIMKKDVVSVLPGDTALDAARAMQERNVGAVAVVSAGALKGVLTDRDILLRCTLQGKTPASVKAAEIMTGEVAFVSPNQPAQDAAMIMATEQVRRLPVVKDGIVCGIVSYSALIRAGEIDTDGLMKDLTE